MFVFAFEKTLFAFEAESPHIEPLFAFPLNSQSNLPRATYLDYSRISSRQKAALCINLRTCHKS